jgi:hypothetical protein
MERLDPSKGTVPRGASAVKLGGGGSPWAASNRWRSLRMSGLPKESTMTMVCPAPVSPADVRAVTP